MIYYLFLLMNTFYTIPLQGTRPIVSLFAQSLGSSSVLIGALVSCFAFFPMLMAITVGKWLDRYGSRQMTLIGAVGMCAALIIPTVVPGYPSLFISQIVIGFSQLCVLVSMQKTVGNLPGNRDKLMAGFSLTGSLGELIGPMLNGFIYEHFGFQWSFVTSLFFVLVGIGLSFALQPSYWTGGSVNPDAKPESFFSTMALLKQTNLRKALMISGMVLYSKDLFVAYFPVYATGLGMSPSNIGVILSTMAAMAIVVRVGQFYLVKKYGRGKVMTTTLVISGFAFLLIPFTSLSILLGIMSMLLGMGLGLGQPLSTVYALNQSPPTRQGEVLGLRLTINRASQFLFPVFFGSIGGVAGVAAIFWSSGAFLIIGSFFTKMKKPNHSSQVIETKQVQI